MIIFFQITVNEFVSAQITVGNCFQSNPNIPITISQNYSCSQQILHNSRINHSGVITSIKLWRSTLTPASITRNINIYLGMTSKNSFDSITDWIPETELRLVFSGNISFPANNWIEITLDNAFTYDNNYNLILAIDDNSNQSVFSNLNDEIRFRGCNQNGYTSLYYESSSVNPDFNNPPPGIRSTFVENVVLLFSDFVSMSNDEIYTCETYYTDPQGVSDYQNNQSITQTIFSNSLSINELTIDFIEFNLAVGDTLIIYDGGNANATIIGVYVNNQGPNSIRASGSSLTLKFISNATDSSSGWLAHVYCQPCNPVSIIAGSPCTPSINGNEYSANPFCTDDNPLGISFPSTTGDSISSESFFGRPYVACLVTLLRPAWYYMQINDPGDMLIYIQQTATNGLPLDVDFACWGPFTANSRIDFLDRLCCGEYSLTYGGASSISHRPTNGIHTNNMGGYPIQNLVDCSADPAATEWCFIPDAQAGEFYILLITNFEGEAGTISFNTNNIYTDASTDCTLLSQVTNNGPLCVGDTLILTCETQLENANYLWVGPNNEGYIGSRVVIPNVNTSMAGEYTLTMTHNGIQSEPVVSNVIINEYPSINTSEDTTICLGDSVTISATGASTYYWNQGLGNGNSHTVYTNVSMTYTVTGYYEGCAVSDSITISIASLPETEIITPTLSLCPNIGQQIINSSTSSGTPNYTYSWSGDNVNNLDNSSTWITIAPNECDTSYNIILTVTDHYGCQATDSGTIYVSDTIPPSLSSVIPNRIAEYNPIGNNYVVPDLSNLITPILSDNCWPNNQLIIIQDPSIGTIITENTLVTTIIQDPCGNIITTTSYVTVPLSYNTSQTNVSCYGGNNGIASCTIHGGSPPYHYLWSTANQDTTQTVNNLTAGLYTITVTDSFSPQASISIWINIYQPEALAVIGELTNTTCGNDNGIINLSTSGGYSPYSFAWNNGETNSHIENLAYGIYYCTITDGVGCTLQDSFDLQTIIPPSISLIITNDTVCPNSNIEVLSSSTNNLGAVDTYLWNGINVQNSNQSNTTITIDPSWCNDSVSIVVTLQDTNNCIVSDTGIIHILDIEAPTYTSSTAPSSTIILGADHIVPNLINYITNTYDNCWNSTQIQLIQNPTAGTIINQSDSAYIYITDPCENRTTFPLYLIAPPPFSISDIEAQNITCAGANNGTLQVTISGGTPPFSYQWSSTTQNSPTITQLAPGTYTVTVTDHYQLTATASGSISEPNPLQYSATTEEWTYCEGNDGSINVQINGGTAPYTYIWNNNSTENHIENLSAGIYSLTVEDDNGCTLSMTDTIRTTFAPIIHILDITDELCHKANGSITIETENGTPTFNYSWSIPNGDNSPSIENLIAGNYSVTVTDIHGCADTLDFIIESFDIEAVLDSVSPDICGQSNGTASVSAIGGYGNYLYNWFDIQNFSENHAFNLVSGSYMMTVSELICIDTIYFEIAEIEMPVACFNISPTGETTTETILNLSNCSSNENNWHWNFGDGEYSSSENPDHKYHDGGIYNIVLTVFNDYDCADSTIQTIEIKEEAYIYFPTAFSPNGDGLNDIYKPICYNISPENYSMVIYNRWGNEVFYTTDINKGWDGTIKGKPFTMISIFSYVVHYRDMFGKPFQIKGSFTLTY